MSSKFNKGLALFGNVEYIVLGGQKCCVLSNFKDMKWQTFYLAGKKGGKVSFLF